MDRTNLKVTKTHLSIQQGFEWNNIPSFAIITGVNGAGKTHLLNLLLGSNNSNSNNQRFGSNSNLDKGYILRDINDNITEFILPKSGNNQNIEGLTIYYKDRINKLAQSKQNDEYIKSYEQVIQGQINLKDTTSDKIELARIDNQIEQYTNEINNLRVCQANLFEYAYEEELKRVSALTGKEIDDLSDADIREKANPNFNHLTEIPDFEIYINQEESDRNAIYVKLSKEGRETEIKSVREAERAFEKINRLFKTFGFDYFEMLDPFPSDKSRTGGVIFMGKKGELVSYPSLSSGEQMIVKFIIWAMGKDIRGNRINTMLLDEPDAHLHPTMCKMMVEILSEISKPKEEGGSGIRIIITTHSPSTVAFAHDQSLFVLEKDSNNERFIRPTTSAEAVAILSDGIFTFEKAINQFSLAMNTTKSNLLFVEGKTDINHIKRANELLEFNLELEIIDMHDAGTLANFVKSTPAKFFRNKRIIALFDCDMEGIKAYKGIAGDEGIIVGAKQITAIQCEGRSYALLIDPPEEIKNYCPIEFLYPMSFLQAKQALTKMSYSGYSTLYKASTTEESTNNNNDYKNEASLRPFKVVDSIKNRLSEEILNESNPELFENFKKTLEIIKEITTHDKGRATAC